LKAKVLRKEFISRLNALDTKNVYIEGVKIARRPLLEALKSLDSEELTLKTGLLSWPALNDSKGKTIINSISDTPCLAIDNCRTFLKFINRGVPGDTSILDITGKFQGKQAEGHEIKLKPFLNALESVIHSVATAQDRPVLNCVYFHKAGMVATDGFRLTFTKIKLPFETLLALPDCLRLVKTLKANKDLNTFTVNVNGTRAVFYFGISSLTLCTSQGTFPEYGKLIPKAGIKAEFDSKQMTKALKSLKVAKDNSELIRLYVQPGSISLKAKSEELGEQSVEIDCKAAGSINIAFNRSYLLDMCKLFKGVINASFTTKTEPGKFAVDNITEVIMPMFVK
jgi:hypothetical protein